MTLSEHQEPLWKTHSSYRLGAKYRSNESRLFYIKNLGWFLRMRGEFNSVSGLTASHGVAGPFPNQDIAFAYLRRSIFKEKQN